MDPNLVTWIFLVGGLLLGAIYYFFVLRKGRSTPQSGSSSDGLSEQSFEFYDSLQDPRNPAPAVGEPTTSMAPSLGQSVSQGINPLPSYAAPAAVQRDSKANGYVRQTTFPSLRPSESQDRLPRIEPGEIPVTGESDYVFGPVTSVLSVMLPESEQRQAEIKKELIHAGYYQPHALQNLNAIRYIAILLAIVGFGALFAIAPPRAELPILGALVAMAIAGWAFPRLYVRGKATERKTEIERALPDVLDMLNMCVSQGMTPLAAMKRVRDELDSVYPEMAQELRIVAEQAQIGTMAHALENMKQRLDIPDVHAFTNLLIQTERMGTSVSSALAEYADRIRESLRQRADEKANQASFRLLFPTVLCLMPAVYMFLLGPSIIELTDFFTGRNQTVNSANQAFQRYTENQNPSQRIISPTP